MTPEKMVHMANQIAQFFAPYGREQAVAGIEDHLRKFWEPRMRAQITTYIASGGEGLHEFAAEAVGRLANK
ncbi:MAG: formate dehydrogenase [Rhodospirillaceae bacterium]|nr:formate dehydrogenase [Rhodospirillaceae bacterium]